MKNPFRTLPVAALLLVVGACSDGNSDAVENAQKVNEARNEAKPDAAQDRADYDSEFMTKAASGGMLEVELGKLVMQRAVTSEAKEFARHMVNEHTRANAELAQLAQRRKITLPTMMGDDQQDVYKDIAEKKGLPFDRGYLREMRQDHEDDIKLFSEAAQKAGDVGVRAFAGRTLPRLREHLNRAIKAEDAIRDRE